MSFLITLTICLTTFACIFMVCAMVQSWVESKERVGMAEVELAKQLNDIEGSSEEEGQKGLYTVN